jgi:fatty acid synthase subunit alpha, fungi type
LHHSLWYWSLPWHSPGRLSAVYNVSSSKIILTISEECVGVSIPLTFLFHYYRNFAPIHDLVEDRNSHIKDFYRHLWFGDDLSMPPLEWYQDFEGPEVIAGTEEIERFCSFVKNEGEFFEPTRSEKVQAPLDFAIVTSWQVCSSYW